MVLTKVGVGYSLICSPYCSWLISGNTGNENDLCVQWYSLKRTTGGELFTDLSVSGLKPNAHAYCLLY